MFEIPLALTLASAIPNLFKIGGGNKELQEADALGRIKQPAYKIPDAATAALTLAKYNALKTRLPGQNIMENKIGAATAGGVRYATETAASPTDALATGAAMIGNQQGALGDLAVQGASMYNKNQDVLRGEYNNYAGWQEKKQNWDVLQPYLMAKQKEAALRTAGAENKMHGIEGLFGSIAGGISLADKKGLFDSSGNYGTPKPNGTDTSSIFNPANTTAPENYPFPNAFPTAQPLEIPNNMGGGNMKDIVSQRFMQRYGRMPTDLELTQLGY